MKLYKFNQYNYKYHVASSEYYLFQPQPIIGERNWSKTHRLERSISKRKGIIKMEERKLWIHFFPNQSLESTLS